MFWLVFSVALLGFVAYPKVVVFTFTVLFTAFVVVPETFILFQAIRKDGPSAFYARIRAYRALFEPIIRNFTRQVGVGIFCVSTLLSLSIVETPIFALATGILFSIGLFLGSRHYRIACHHTDHSACFSGCRHLEIPMCMCFVEKDTKIDNLTMQLKIYKDANEDLRQQPQWSPVSPRFPSSQITREHTQLRDDFTKFKIIKELEVNALRNTIRQLEARIIYAGDASLDRIQMKEKVDTAVVRQRENEEQLLKLKQERDELILALAAERDYIWVPCDDINVCDEEKRSMMLYSQRLEAELREHHDQVQEAARVLGYRQDNGYISLPQFLVQTVVEAKAHALTCRNPQGALLPSGLSPTEDLIRTLQITNNRNFKYVARLEDEILSRGGNLNDLQIEGPRVNRWYVAQERKYEDAAQILFFVYGELNNTISVLNGFLHLAGQDLPPWIDTGHDESLTVMDADRFASTERLSYKLVESECFNLYWRALQLLHHCESGLEQRLLLHGESDNEYVLRSKTLQPVKRRMHILMEFFSYPQDIRYPNNQRLPETTVERRFTIYVGMMNMIRELHIVIYAWHAKEEIAGRLRTHHRPLWKLPQGQVYLPPPSKTTYESLIKFLTEREINALADRIYTLWFHMDKKLKMPGTEDGKIIYGDGDNWDIAEPYTAEFARIKEMWLKAGKWVGYWKQRPKPGSIKAMDKIPGKDGWLPNPDDPLSGNDVDDSNKNSKDKDHNEFSCNNYNNQQQKNKKGESEPPAWFKKSKLEKNLKSQRDRLKVENERHRARIRQLSDRLQTPDSKSKVERANVSWEVPKIKGNFLNIKGGGFENDIYRSWTENEKMKGMVDTLENVFRQAKIQIPKTLWK